MRWRWSDRATKAHRHYNYTINVTLKRSTCAWAAQVRSDGGDSLPTGSGQQYTMRVFVDKSVIEAHLGTPVTTRSVTTRYYPLDLHAAGGAFGLKVLHSYTAILY